jgi:DNA-binding NtrC family response regulator
VLVEHFVTKCCARTDRHIENVSPEAMQALMHYLWPGNVRELENMIERVVVLNRSGSIDVSDLPEGIREATVARPQNRQGTLHELERQRIIDALRESQGNKKRAAQELGIHRSTLYAKMKRYTIEIESPRDETEVVEKAGSDAIPEPVTGGGHAR